MLVPRDVKGYGDGSRINEPSLLDQQSYSLHTKSSLPLHSYFHRIQTPTSSSYILHADRPQPIWHTWPCAIACSHSHYRSSWQKRHSLTGSVAMPQPPQPPQLSQLLLPLRSPKDHDRTPYLWRSFRSQTSTLFLQRFKSNGKGDAAQKTSRWTEEQSDAEAARAAQEQIEPRNKNGPENNTVTLARTSIFQDPELGSCHGDEDQKRIAEVFLNRYPELTNREFYIRKSPAKCIVHNFFQTRSFQTTSVRSSKASAKLTNRVGSRQPEIFRGVASSPSASAN